MSELHCRILGDTFHSDMLVRFSHCDPAGIVFYPQYFIMFNGLVEDWFNQGLGVDYARYITEHRLGFPIVRLECDFVAPSKIGEIITLGLKLERLGRSSMEIAVDCRHGKEERLRARFVLVTMDLDRQRAQPVPDDLRALMLAFRQGQFDINNHQRRDT
jgi:4-hydroxybenzoyl-CoA thioesterase